MFFSQIFGRKSLDHLIAEMAGENRLHRALGPLSLTALGVGAIIGAGIFVMTGRTAAEVAGPAVMLSYAVAAVGCLFAALCYAEFAAMAPVAGSAYTYAYATLGELCAWIIGWDLILEYAMSCACVASAWANYLNEFLRTVFNTEIPAYLCSDPFTKDPNTHLYGWFNLPAVLIMCVITTILVIGIRESAWTNAILTLVKLFVVLFVIGLGLGLMNTSNWFNVPFSTRLSGAEMAAGKAASELLTEWRPKEKPPTAEEIGALAAASKAKKRLEIELTGIQEREDLDQLSADQAAELAKAFRAKLQPVVDAWPDPSQVDLVLEEAAKQAPEFTNRKWGMLGQIIRPETLTPIDNATRSNFSPYGFSGIMLGASLVFFAFIGFDSISTHSEEAINPQRDVPLAILLSLILCTFLYVMVAGVITAMEPYPQIDTKAAVASAFRRQAQLHNNGMLRAAAALIATGALAGLTSVILVTFLSQARVFLAMARDRLLPPSIFGAIHPRFKTPHISTTMTGLFICLVTAFTPIQVLEEMVNIGTLFAFVVVCITVLLLRFQNPGMHRPFRCPLVYVVAPLGIVVNVTMMLFLPWETWLRLVIWMGIGLLVYFWYGFHHSVLGRELVEQLAKEGVGPTDAPLNTGPVN